MTEQAEQALKALRDSVDELKAEVAALEEDSEQTGEERDKKTRLVSERITQSLIAVDAVDISKDAATEAFKARDRNTAMKMSVLLTRRKNLVRDLTLLGERIDKST